MFEHLTALKAEDFMDLDDMTASDTLTAQAGAVDFFSRFGSDPEIISEDSAQLARDAFAKVTNPAISDADAKAALMRLKVPGPVKHIAGMLSQYDWDFVDQAKEMRGYAVAGIMEETKHPDARIRLKALDMLGKITEVALFTERVEIKKIDATTDELTERLRAKLTSLLPRTIEVETVIPKTDA
jgi:hypothetical protein